MSKYNILRWDAVLAKNGINKIPMIYIQPDTSFLQFIKNNNDMVEVQIEGTTSIYDGKVISGSVSKAGFLPDFYSSNNLYVIILSCDWFGYPNFLGTSQFYGLNGI